MSSFLKTSINPVIVFKILIDELGVNILILFKYFFLFYDYFYYIIFYAYRKYNYNMLF